MLKDDLRYALRTLRRSPGFAAVAILILAFGIGATTAMFSVMDGVLLKPLRYPDAGRIVAVLNRWKDTGRTQSNLAGGDVIDVSADRDTFEAFSYYNGWGEAGVQVAGRAEFVGASLVHPDFFRVFSLAPVAGRPLNLDDAERSAVVSLSFAQRNFGSAQAALGKAIFVESRSYQLVGVMPAAMRFPERAEVWLAAPLLPENRNRTGHNYRCVAKLRPGVSLEVANARLAAVGARLAAAFPESNGRKTFVATPLRDQLAGPVRTTLYFLMGAVGLILLIACANVANLMLARATARAREMAVRTALGAARRHIIRQLLTESLVLASVAAVVGLLLAYFGVDLLLRVGAHNIPLPRLSDIGIDLRVLLFTMVTSVAASIGFGLAPAWQASRVDLHQALKQGTGRGLVGGGSSRLRSGLVVTQIALSFTLAIGAVLLVRSFVALTEVQLGYRTESVLVMYAHAPARGSLYEKSGLNEYIRAGQFFDDLFASMRHLPGVVSVGGAMGLPTGQYDSNGSYAIEGKSTFGGDYLKLPNAGFRLASPSYFSTLGIPLLRGRDFNDGDLYDRPFVVIISESLARQSFPNEDPIGHRIMCGFDSPNWMTIVGVVGDVRQYSPSSQPAPEMYMPLRQHPYAANEVQVVVRTQGDPALLTPTVQQVVHELNPEVATKFTTLEASVSDSIAAPRFRMTLGSTFAALALLLALAGMYAVMSYVTTQRTSEFGLRLALGAQPGDVLRLVLGRAAGLAGLGVACGLALAFAGSRALSTMLFGLKTTDLPTYALVLVGMMPLVLLAAAIPALRASRVDPMVALRNE